MCNTLTYQAHCSACNVYHGPKERKPPYKCPKAKQMLSVLGACGKLDHINVPHPDKLCPECKKRDDQRPNAIWL
ncbi:hypothetical protein Hte_009019 [Hypoxylon texense]